MRWQNICNQYNTHIINNDIAEIYQSAYKPTHSVETAIVCVHNALVRAIDKKYAVLLVLLDLSAAFDTVDSCKLLEVLKMWLAYLVLQWPGLHHTYRIGPKKSVLTINIHPRQNSSGVYHKGQFFLQHIYSHSMKFWGNWG